MQYASMLGSCRGLTVMPAHKGAWLRHSLRGKITLGYYAVAVAILVASVFFVGELRTLEARVVLGQRATDLFNTVLEIRRFERNYFLHHEAVDLEENARYIKLAQEMLTANRAGFSAIATQARLAQLRALLDDYQRRMSAFAAGGQQPVESFEPGVRSLGKEVVTIAEDMAALERRQIQTTLASFSTLLLGVIVCMALLIVLIGRALSLRVVGPLQEMEASVVAISTHRRESLSAPSNDREIISIIEAFNRMLKELDVRQKSLMRSERLASLGTLLSGVAHELNNPLSNISSSCQILSEEIGDPDISYKKELLSQIDEQTDRARNIVRSLLEFSREKVFKKELIRLRELFEETIRFVKGQVPTNIAIELNIPAEITIYADKQRMQQAFLNLIKNAIDSMGDTGDIRIRAARHNAIDKIEGEAEIFNYLKYHGKCTLEEDTVDIIIDDSGPGIPQELIPRIFDP